MSQRCAVVGIGQTKHDTMRVDVSLNGLLREAVDRAMKDADVGWKDIHAFETAVLGNAGLAEIEVHIRTRDKRVWHFKANTFVSKTNTQVIDVTNCESRGPWRDKPFGLSEIRWTMEGVCTGSNTIEAWEGRR